MEIKRAIEILRRLADGVDPLTGELLPPDSVCNKAEVVRALHSVLAQMDCWEKKQRVQPKNAGKPWLEEESNQLRDEFRANMKISEMARQHGRSRGAIEAKLAKLGLMEKKFGFFFWRRN